MFIVILGASRLELRHRSSDRYRYVRIVQCHAVLRGQRLAMG
jgi:hypothetical protein